MDDGNADQATLLRTDPEVAASEAGLRYVSDAQPGYRRRRRGKGFSYHDEAGALVASAQLKARFERLVIPPNWDEVWICKAPGGHLQATGVDAKGRKQYLYHERWREIRDQAKFETLAQFGRALPGLRARVEADLSGRGLTRDKLVAAVIALLERTLVRIGNPRYASANKTYGLTTLRKKHVTTEGATLELSFVGKSGVLHEVSLEDRRLARIVRACAELPGYELFKYQDEAGETRLLESADVNAYLQETTGEVFTAKDFRTWAATALALEWLCAEVCPEHEPERTKVLAAAVRRVAGRLGHTPAVCRSAYIYPKLLSHYQAGELSGHYRDALARCASSDHLSEHEAALIAYLEV